MAREQKLKSIFKVGQLQIMTKIAIAMEADP